MTQMVHQINLSVVGVLRIFHKKFSRKRFFLHWMLNVGVKALSGKGLKQKKAWLAF